MMGMAMNVNYHNPIIAFMKNWIQHYNHDRYWRIDSLYCRLEEVKYL